MRKRLLAVLLTLAMVLGAAMVSAVAEDGTAADSVNETELGFLTAIGVLNDSFDPGATVTKAQFAAMVAIVLYPDVDFFKLSAGADAPALYHDVTASHMYYSEIKACKDLKIINGNGDGNFYPDEGITVLTGITILINALGYKPYADINGGFPTGYYTIANETGITKGVSGNGGTEISGSVAAKLVYNALFADAIRITSVINGETSIEVNRGKNVLSEHLGIKEYDAIVADDGVSSMNGESMMEDGRVILQEYKTGTQYIVYEAASSVSGYFGQRIKAFVKYNAETGKDEVLYAAAHTMNKITTVNSDRILSVSDTAIEYEREKNDDKTLKISLGTTPPLVFINGSLIADYTKEDLKPQDGLVRFIDYDGNGKTDIIQVECFNYFNGIKQNHARNIVTDRVDSEHKVINCKFNPANSVDLEDDSLYDYRVMKDGKTILIEDIKAGDIVSVAESPKPIKGKTFYTLYVSDKTAEGSVSSKDEAGKEIFLADGTSLEFSSSLLSVKKNMLADLSYEKEITFSLDVLGKIAYVDELAKDVPNYAYIIGVQQDTDFGDDVLKLKLFTKEGEFAVYELSSKAKIDGSSFSNTAEAITLLNTRPDGTVSAPANGTKVISRPAIVEINSDRMIKEIDTDAPNYGGQENKLEAGKRYGRTGIYFTALKTFDGSFYLNESTVVLKVADIDRYKIEETQDNSIYNTRTVQKTFIQDHEMDPNDIKNYASMKAGQMKQTYSYDAQAYAIDPDTGVAGLVVLRGADMYNYQDQKYNLPYCVFKKLTKVIDEETGEEIYKIYYFSGGSEKSVVVDPANLHLWYRSIIFGDGVMDARKVQTKAQPVPVKIGGKDVVLPGAEEYEGLKEGDVSQFEASNGKLSHIQRNINISKINHLATGTLLPTAPNAPYTTASLGMLSTTAAAYDGLRGLFTNVERPFDGRALANYTLDQTYNVFLGTALNIKDGKVQLRLPSVTHANYMLTDTAGNVIGAKSVKEHGMTDTDSVKCFDWLFSLYGAKITVVEEQECHAGQDNCKFKIRSGSINDIKTAASFSSDIDNIGFFQASMVSLFGTKGKYTDCIVFHLTREHNQYIH